MANDEITNQEYPLSFNSYAAFDAVTLKGLMQQRLIDGGVFTDQIFEGSNFNSLLDVIAYSYHVLLFYLNRTANESSFSNAQLYENVNRIVKILNYNPVGIQTSMLSFSALASNNLPVDIYTIPRYAYFSINDINYSFNQDITFTKTLSGVQSLNELNDNSLLYQGTFIENPVYISNGEPFEEFTIISVNEEGENDFIDHNNIYVFVKTGNNPWREYKSINSLYLENPLSESYEIRLNENQRYTIKFGNGVTGKKLNKGDFIAVYYLRSEGVDGEIGPSVLNGSRLYLYDSSLYSEIMRDVRTIDTNILEFGETQELNFTNSVPSSKFSFQEDSVSIKQNAINTYKTQYRLVNNSDFENYIKKNFSNLILDVKAVNNDDYVNQHLNYYNELGLSEPNMDSRILLNQINFANSCNFNNIYIYCIPKVPLTNYNNFNKFLNLGAKNVIESELNKYKILTSEIVFQDPVYMSIGLGVTTPEEISNEGLNPELINETYLRVKKSPQSFISDNSIIENIVNLFKNYFDDQKLGKRIDIEFLNSAIFRINGVESYQTERIINNQSIIINGLSFLLYNPIYFAFNEDIQVISQSVQLPFFKTSYYNDYDVLKNHIIIE
jgi:hypothetical protein